MKDLLALILLAAFAIALPISIMGMARYFFSQESNKQYTVIRANCTDTITVKADTFRVNIREHTAYFTNGNGTFAIDSINCIKSQQQ